MPEIPDAAYRASMSPSPVGPPEGSIGVSGGGGDPREARVVALEAELLNRLTPDGLGMWSCCCWGCVGAVDPRGGG